MKKILSAFSLLLAVGIPAFGQSLPWPGPGAASASDQLATYNCSPIENPISDGGNITALGQAATTGQSIAGNLCEATAINTFVFGFYTGITWPNNQFSEITLQALVNPGDYLPVMVRKVNSTAATYYAFNFQNGSTQVYAVITGTWHSLATLTGYSFAAGDKLRFGVKTGTGNNVLHVYKNGVEMAGSPVTDSTYYATLTGGVPGYYIYCTAAIANCRFSNWSGGEQK